MNFPEADLGHDPGDDLGPSIPRLAAQTLLLFSPHRAHKPPARSPRQRRRRLLSPRLKPPGEAAQQRPGSQTRYRAGLELGCGQGQVTRRLARYCARLLAIDHSATALGQAMQQCLHWQHVEFCQRLIPEQFPPGFYDFIFFSEPATYLSALEFLATLDQILAHLQIQGYFAMGHCYNQPVRLLGVDDLHELVSLYGGDRLHLRKSRQTEEFRLDIWQRVA
jgi:SAM-dependent methyltransferase